ncbi:MAG: hypothetical protein ABW252_12240 [Polyangiales bacterium]
MTSPAAPARVSPRAASRIAMLTTVSISAALLHGASVARADERDPWLGRDKALHAGLSAALAAGGYAASVPLFEPRPARAACGVALSLTLGAAKELYDLAGHGTPSARDFTWDVIGALTGASVATLVDFAIDRIRARRARHARAHLSISNLTVSRSGL